MALNRLVEITLNNARTPGRILLRSLVDPSPGSFSWVEDDKFKIRVRFADIATNLGGAAIAVQLELDNNITLGARKARGTGPLLFSVTNFTRVVVPAAGDVPADYYYDAVLNLNTVAMDAIWGNTQTTEIWVDVEVQAPDADDGLDPDKITFQFQVTMVRQAYDGSADPAAGDPDFPHPATIAHVDADGKHLLSEIPGVIKAGNGYNPGEEDFEFKAGGTYEVKINAYEVFALEEVEGARITVVCIEDNDGNYIPAIDDSLQPGLLYEFHFVNGSWSYGFRPWVDSNSLSTGRLGATTPAGARGSIGVSNNYSAVTITGAGNTTVSAWGNARRGARRITVNAGTYAATVAISTSSAVSDDRAELDFLMPASIGPVVTVNNATSGGTLLATIPTDAAVARSWRVIAQFNGASWQLLSLAPINFNEAAHAVVDSLVGAREARQMLILDGSAFDAARADVTLPLGTSFDFTVVLESSDTTHHNCVLSSREGAGGGSTGIVFFWYSTGEFGYYSGTASNAAQNFAVIPRDGKRHLLHVSLTATTATAWVDGVPQNYIGCNWGTSTGPFLQVFSETTAGGSSPSFYGKAALIGITNYNMSAADREYLRLNGVYPATDRGGSMTALNALAWSNVASAYAPFASADGATLSAATSGSFGQAYSYTSRLIEKGRTVRISFNLVLNSGQLPSFGMAEEGVGNAFSLVAAAGYNEVTVTLNRTSGYLFFNNSAPTDWAVTNLKIILLGTIVQYGAWDGKGRYWPSSNGDGKHLLLVGGAATDARPLLKAARGEVAKDVYTSGAAILSIVVQAGQSYTAGDVLGELILPTGHMAFGEWLVTCENASYSPYTVSGSRFSGGGMVIFGADRVLAVTARQAGGMFGGDALCVDLKIVGADSLTTTRVQLVAAFTSTHTETQTMRLYHLSGILDRSLVK